MFVLIAIIDFSHITAARGFSPDPQLSRVPQLLFFPAGEWCRTHQICRGSRKAVKGSCVCNWKPVKLQWRWKPSSNAFLWLWCSLSILLLYSVFENSEFPNTNSAFLIPNFHIIQCRFRPGIAASALPAAAGIRRTPDPRAGCVSLLQWNSAIRLRLPRCVPSPD